jgi:hypothetical protein
MRLTSKSLHRTPKTSRNTSFEHPQGQQGGQDQQKRASAVSPVTEDMKDGGHDGAHY